MARLWLVRSCELHKKNPSLCGGRAPVLYCLHLGARHAPGSSLGLGWSREALVFGLSIIIIPLTRRFDKPLKATKQGKRI